jgi:hypothetical protein
MSALPPKADIDEGDWHVRLVPKADIAVLVFTVWATLFFYVAGRI